MKLADEAIGKFTVAQPTVHVPKGFEDYLLVSKKYDLHDCNNNTANEEVLWFIYLFFFVFIAAYLFIVHLLFLSIIIFHSFILPAKAWEYVFTGVGLCVCLTVCVSVCDHDN